MKISKNRIVRKMKTNPVLFLLPFLIFGFIACSSGEDAIDFSHSHHNKFHNSFDLHRNGFSFEDSGDWYKVKFRDGEIYKLYINGERVASNEIDEYADLVYDKREELRESFADLRNEWEDCDFDMDEFRENMAEFKHEFGYEIREAMREVKRELRNVDFDRIRADVDLDELHASLAELKNIKVNLNMDDFHSNMDELADNLNNIRFEFNDHDWDEFNNEMRNLKDELKNIDIDMSDLKFEMKKLKRFMKDFRRELVDDGYLEYGNDDFNAEFNNDELIIDGKRLPDNLLQKYKKMYKEHFGKEIEDGFRFRN